MNPFERKVTARVLGIHFGVVAILLMQSALRGCFRQKPKPEIVTFIEFGAPAPSVHVQPVAKMADPEPVAPTPAPTPEPTVVPEPVKKTVELPAPAKKKATPPPKKVDSPKPKPPEKKKWTPTKVDPSKSRRIEPKTTAPAVSERDIQEALKGITSSTKPSSTAPAGNPDDDAAYISQIGNFFDRLWTKPESSAPTASAVVRIHISKWGTITRRIKIQGSGDAAFDASVMSAVKSVDSVPKPPSGFPYDYVEVEFRIRN